MTNSEYLPIKISLLRMALPEQISQVRSSKALVASSRIKTFGLWYKALAIPIR